jgi:uncharacterized protein YqhQ
MSSSPKKTVSVGGQAVIEGVMMRAPNAIATAVRRANGEITIKTEPFTSLLERKKYLNIPILRGTVALVEMTIIGTRALQYSADIMSEDMNDNSGKQATSQKEKSKLGLIATTLIALGLGVVIFFVGPLFIANEGLHIEKNAWQFNLAAGTIRIALFLSYLLFISMMKDIFRIFQYHGAEHLAVYTFENKEPLTPEHALKYDTPHPRCGTSFLMFVMLSSIITFAIIDSIYLLNVGSIDLAARILLHVPFIPVVAGISYELIKFSGKYYDNPLAKLFMIPGLLLQRITTKQPDERQVEVSIAALKAALGDTVVNEYEKGNVVGSMSVHECRITEPVTAN